MNGPPAAESDRPHERWPAALALGAVVLLSVAACTRKIWAADFWWQLATGRYVLEHGWPSVDPFSYTAAGQPWIELRWLFCVVEFLVMRGLGPAGLILLKWLAVVAAFGLVSLPVLRGRIPVVACATWAIALLAASQRLFVRPELATFVFFGLFVWILDRHRRVGGQAVWTLPALQLLWVNTHTLFILGPALVGLSLAATAIEAARGAFRDARARLLGQTGLLVAVVAACLANPWGLDGLLFPLRLFEQIRGTAFKQAIGEFHSPFAYGGAFTAVAHYEILIGIVLVTAVAGWRRLDPFWALVCLSQLYLSTQAIRNLPLFSLAAVPFVISSLDRSELRGHPAIARRLPVARRVVALLVVAVCGYYAIEMATDRYNVRQGDTNQFGLGIAEHRYPVRATAFLERTAPQGAVFGTLLENAYLIHAGRRVFMDPRLEVYGERGLLRFLEVQRDPGAWRRAVEAYDIRSALVDPRARITRLLVEQAGWDLVYFDETAAVFVRQAKQLGLTPIEGRAAFERAAGQLRVTLGRPERPARGALFRRVRSPDPYLSVADFLLLCSQADAAQPFLDDAEAAWPGVRGMPLRRATLAELRGDWAEVIEQARAGLREDPEDPRLELKLGVALYRSGQPLAAEVALESALRGLPDRPLAWGMLGNIRTERQQYDEAARCYARAVELDPLVVVYRINLAQVQAKRGLLGEAARELALALELDPQNPLIARDLALVYAALGDEETARRYVELGLSLAPDDPRLRELAGRFRLE